jgi:hypothetical protein
MGYTLWILPARSWGHAVCCRTRHSRHPNSEAGAKEVCGWTLGVVPQAGKETCRRHLGSSGCNRDCTSLSMLTRQQVNVEGVAYASSRHDNARLQCHIHEFQHMLSGT